MKKVLYVVIAIGVIYLVLALFGKSRVVVERSATVNKPADLVKKHLADLKFFHDQWSPWTEKDPGMAVTYSGNPGEPGHKMEWSSKVKGVGQGTLEITGADGDSILQKLTFKGMGDSKSYYIVSGKENSSNVTWGMDMHIGFFARPIMMFMNMDKMIGPDYEKGLAKLKTVMENMKEEGLAANYEVKEMEWPEVTYVGTPKETVKFENLSAFFGKHFPAIGQELGKNKIQPEAAPSAIYMSYDEKKGETECAAVFKVPNGTKLKGYQTHTFPASNVLHIAYYGDYAKSANAHYAMDDYMKGKGVSQTAVIEEYVTDPGVEKDTTKWLTNIYYILKK